MDLDKAEVNSIMDIIMENADRIHNAIKKFKSKQPNSENIVKGEMEG